jgi:Ca2+-binding EF-hand superfamily protein
VNIKVTEEIFRNLNKKNNGKMTRKELVDGYKEYFLLATQEEMEAIFYAADLNKDGYLDIKEWKTAMSMRQSQL